MRGPNGPLARRGITERVTPDGTKNGSVHRVLPALPGSLGAQGAVLRGIVEAAR